MKRILVALLFCSAPAFAAVPTLVQHMSVGDNPGGTGIDGNDFAFFLPNDVRAGNALVLGVAFCSTASPNCTTVGNDLCHAGGSCTVPITDNNGNTWPTAPAVRVNDANTNIDMAIFVLPNANAGSTQITIHFTAAIHPMTFSISEFNNVATSSPVDVTASGSNVSAPTVTTSITPTVDGDLIWVMAYDDANFGGTDQVTTWAPATNFKLLDADIGWNGNTNAHKASAYFVQGTHGAVSAGFTATMTPANDPFSIVAVALKSASAGTSPPNTMRILRQIGNTNEVPPASWTMQLPSDGNLLIVVTSTTSEDGHLHTTGITDTKSNTWGFITHTGWDNTEPQIWYAKNATSSNDLKWTVTSINAANGTSWTMYDVVNADADPFTNAAGSPTASVNCNSVTSLTHFPDFTPIRAGGFNIAALQLGDGPGLAVTASPDTAHWGFVTYTGETDLDTMQNADGRAHVFNPSGSTENWTWTITSRAANSCSSIVAHFAASPVPPPSPPIPFLLPDFQPIGQTLGLGRLNVCTAPVIDGKAQCVGSWISEGTLLICQSVGDQPSELVVDSTARGNASISAPGNPRSVQCIGGSPP